MSRAYNLLVTLSEFRNDERSSDHQRLVDYYLPRAGELLSVILYRTLGINKDPNRPITVRRASPSKEKSAEFSMWLIIPTVNFPPNLNTTSGWKKLNNLVRESSFNLFQELTSETHFHPVYEQPGLSPDAFIMEIGLRETKPQKFVGRYLYHQTSARAAKKIEKEGLLPNKSPYHANIPSRATDRIFFTQKPQKKEDTFLGRNGAVQYRVDRRKHLKNTTLWGHHRGGEILIDHPIPASALEKIPFEESVMRMDRAKHIQQLFEAHLHFRSPQGTEEHDEVHMQLQAHKQGMNDMPDHTHKYLQHLADPDNYSKALHNARVETYNKSSVRRVTNTDASDGISSLNPMKRKRVSSIYKQGNITSPIILRHRETGHEYLLAGNTRLTHGIHVAKKPVKVSVLEY